MPERVCAAVILLAVSSLAAACLPAQRSLRSGRSQTLAPVAQGAPLQTPDGSRFLLIPNGDMPAIYWAIAAPAGDMIDPPDFPGLSFATARASLGGSDTIGTLDWAKECETTALIAELAEQRRQPQADLAAIDAELATARAQLAAVRDASAWVRELYAAPAIDFELREQSDCVVLGITTTPAGLARVAQLIVDRRENTRLRNLDTHYTTLTAERARRIDDPRRRLLAEIRELAYFGTSHRNADGSTDIDHDRAIQVYRRCQSPSSTLHVLIGGFDVDPMTAFLREQFATTRLPATQINRPTRRRSSRERRSTVLGGACNAVAVGLVIPDEVNPDDVETAASWLADGPDSFVARQLRSRGWLNLEVSSTTPFPANAHPGLLLVEVWPSKRQDLGSPQQDLTDAVLEIITGAGTSNLGDGPSYTHSISRMRGHHAVELGDPREYAFYLAASILHGRPYQPDRTPLPKYEEIRALHLKIFTAADRVIASLQPDQASQSDR